MVRQKYVLGGGAIWFKSGFPVGVALSSSAMVLLGFNRVSNEERWGRSRNFKKIMVRFRPACPDLTRLYS